MEMVVGIEPLTIATTVTIVTSADEGLQLIHSLPAERFLPAGLCASFRGSPASMGSPFCWQEMQVNRDRQGCPVGEGR